MKCCGGFWSSIHKSAWTKGGGFLEKRERKEDFFPRKGLGNEAGKRKTFLGENKKQPEGIKGEREPGQEKRCREKGEKTEDLVKRRKKQSWQRPGTLGLTVKGNQEVCKDMVGDPIRAFGERGKNALGRTWKEKERFDNSEA